MSYQFVENRYPTSDPNTDLNFNNDILYENIVRDEARISRAPPKNHNVVPKKPERKPIKKTETKEDSSNLIYVLFIFIVILAIILWYVYSNNGNSQQNNKKVLDVYQSEADLAMLSPDFGNGERYGLKG